MISFYVKVELLLSMLLIISRTMHRWPRVRLTYVTREEHFPLANSNIHNLLTYLLDIPIGIH